MPYWLASLSFDDGDVGVAHVALELRAHIIELLSTLLQQRRHRHTRDPRGRPQENLRGAVVADDLRLHMRGRRQNAQRDGRESAGCRGRCRCSVHDHDCPLLACNVGERIGRIGDRDQHRLRSGAHDLRDNLPIDRGVLFKSLSRPCGSLRSVAPPVFSLTPEVISTTPESASAS